MGLGSTIGSTVACIGECMIELRERPDGSFSRGFGGDTFNTALYLARLGVSVEYVTALGDDPWSEELVAAWAAEGIGTGHVLRLPGTVPGLYVIQTDAAGERRFSYWRDSAPVRRLFAGDDTDALIAALSRTDVLYASGITLSLFGDEGRARLFAAIEQCRAHGGRFVFDTNFRPRGWPDAEAARDAYRRAFAYADILLASVEDLSLLFGPAGESVFLDCANPRERVLKLAQPSCRVIGEGVDAVVPSRPAVPLDTTAAGDSFAAAYLAARLAGRTLEEAAQAGHCLAGAVVMHPGAIIPLSAMPSGLRFDAAPADGDAPG